MEFVLEVIVYCVSDLIEEIFKSETIPEKIPTSKISEEIVKESLNTPEKIIEEAEASLKSKIIQHFHDYHKHYAIAGLIIGGIGTTLWISYLVHMAGVHRIERAYSMIPKKEDLICYQNNPMIFDSILEIE